MRILYRQDLASTSAHTIPPKNCLNTSDPFQDKKASLTSRIKDKEYLEGRFVIHSLVARVVVMIMITRLLICIMEKRVPAQPPLTFAMVLIH